MSTAVIVALSFLAIVATLCALAVIGIRYILRTNGKEPEF